MRNINEIDYVDKAEAAICNHKNQKRPNGRPMPMVTTSKIRNLLSMSADIYNNAVLIQEEKLTNDLVERIQYLRMRFVYECGRDPDVKRFVTEANILEILKEIGSSKANYILFNKYMEALIAFHKYYDGKD